MSSAHGVTRWVGHRLRSSDGWRRRPDAITEGLTHPARHLGQWGCTTRAAVRRNPVGVRDGLSHCDRGAASHQYQRAAIAPLVQATAVVMAGRPRCSRDPGVRTLTCGTPTIAGPRPGVRRAMPRVALLSTSDTDLLSAHSSRADHVPVSYTHLRAHETDSYLVC